MQEHLVMKIKAKLVLTVWYDDVEDPEVVKDLLEGLVQTAANRGELSGEGPETVDTYEAHVTTERA